MGSAPKSAFQKIAFFNTLIGNDNASALEGLRAQFACVEEEFKELQVGLLHYCQGVEAINKGDYTAEEVFGVGGFQEGIRELRDGIADVLVTVYGLAHRAGIDADKDLEIVNKSNMSKFITTSTVESQDAFDNRVGEEMAYLDTKGVDYVFNETASNVWAFTSKHDQTGKDGKFYPKGKLLKPSTYQEPDFNKTDNTLPFIVEGKQVFIGSAVLKNHVVDPLISKIEFVTKQEHEDLKNFASQLSTQLQALSTYVYANQSK